MLTLFVPKERREGETRVAATPETVKALIKEGLRVVIERDAGANAFIPDAQFEAAGAVITDNPKGVWREADLILKAAPLISEGEHSELDLMKPGATLIGMLAPYKQLKTVKALADKKITAIAMELLPRTSRAQSMDVLSSQANIAGYKAVLLAATHLGKYFPLFMTAAGTIQPARVVVMGAGVAGLQAIATAKRLGAIVEVSDVRPAVKEQVESLGAKFIDVPDLTSEGSGGYAKELSKEALAKQQAVVAERVKQADVVITTALIPGRPAPRLVTAETVQAMRPGSVIVDLAVEQGGNCELSEMGKTVVKHGVQIIGHANLPATLPLDASTLLARNFLSFLKLSIKDGSFTLDLQDDIIQNTLLTHEGSVVHTQTQAALKEQGL